MRETAFIAPNNICLSIPQLILCYDFGLDKWSIETMEVRQFSATEAGQRLDKAVVAFLPDYSRSQIQEMIEVGHVLVDGKNAKASQKLKGGESIEITLIEAEAKVIKPEAIPLTIVYEDKDIVVVDKEAGM